MSYPITDGFIRGLSWQSGAAEDPCQTVLCLHGWLDNCHSFLPLLCEDTLTDVLQTQQAALEMVGRQSYSGLTQTSSWRFIAIDWPGHGHSSHKPHNYHFADWVGDLHQVVQALGPVHIIGHSLGGMVASCFAAAFPEWVRSLVLLESAGPLALAVTETTSHLRQALLKRQSPASSRAPKLRSLQQLQHAKARALALSIEDGISMVARDNVEEQGQYRWRHDQKLLQISPFRLAPAQAEQLVSSIKCPTLCLLAKQGHQQIADHFHARQDLFQQLSYQQLPGHHHFHIEHAEAVGQAVEEFFVKL
ncbi:alpha/beta fold hydrolase [Motilimonas pumila]|uniref:alpha/beta fold hydrolase n=1 Tax=Motilimonas pumila TaxID=2303987 RepID=UPI001314F87C|nr:alpha/beta hydrolase [Motilimonas pumila]